jgi:hypothetical protein
MIPLALAEWTIAPVKFVEANLRAFDAKFALFYLENYRREGISTDLQKPSPDEVRVS